MGLCQMSWSITCNPSRSPHGDHQALTVGRSGRRAGLEDVGADVQCQGAATHEIARDGLQLSAQPVNVERKRHIAVSARLGQRIRRTCQAERDGLVDLAEHVLGCAPEAHPEVGGVGDQDHLGLLRRQGTARLVRQLPRAAAARHRRKPSMHLRRLLVPSHAARLHAVHLSGSPDGLLLHELVQRLARFARHLAIQAVVGQRSIRRAVIGLDDLAQAFGQRIEVRLFGSIAGHGRHVQYPVRQSRPICHRLSQWRR